jgi:hypothetical protein
MFCISGVTQEGGIGDTTGRAISAKGCLLNP